MCLITRPRKFVLRRGTPSVSSQGRLRTKEKEPGGEKVSKILD